MRERYVFADIAYASGVAPKTIRNWLDREQVEFVADVERDGGGFRKFAASDALLIAMTKRLVDYCVDVQTAADMVKHLVFPRTWRQIQNNMPTSAMVSGFTGRALYVWRDGDEWVAKVSAYAEPPDGLPDTVLCVDIERVAQDVVAKLQELEQAAEPNKPKK